MGRIDGNVGTGAVSDLPSQITALKGQLDALLNTSSAAATLGELQRWYATELTYTSNAIEGNTITRQETAVILEHGVTVPGKPLKDHNEIVGHYAAVEYVQQLAADTALMFTEEHIKTIHKILMERVWPAEAGHYSQHQRRIAGSAVVFPSAIKIPREMASFADWLQQSHSCAAHETAIEAHFNLVRIHPFSDGNGRTARLLMNGLLWQAGYPPINIKPEHRLGYLQVLEQRSVDHSIKPYRQFMQARLLETLQDYVQFLTDGGRA